MNKWFTILTSRNIVQALSLRNEEAYSSALKTLNLVLEVFTTLTVGDAWKPVQTHIVVATEALLDIQHHLLYDKGYDFVFMGRFTNDVAENIFSCIRRRRATPSPLEAKFALKAQTLSQCNKKVLKSPYDQDDRVNILCLEEIVQWIERNGPSPSVVSELLPWVSPDLSGDLSGVKFHGQRLYHICGYILHSMRGEGRLKCDVCYDQLQNQGDVPDYLKKWTEKTNYVSEAQVEVCLPLFHLFYAIEYNIKNWHTQLVKSGTGQPLVEKSVKPHLIFYPIPTCPCCPNLKEILASRFISFKLKISGQSGMVATPLASKSMGMRHLADRFHVSNKRAKK